MGRLKATSISMGTIRIRLDLTVRTLIRGHLEICQHTSIQPMKIKVHRRFTRLTNFRVDLLILGVARYAYFSHPHKEL